MLFIGKQEIILSISKMVLLLVVTIVTVSKKDPEEALNGRYGEHSEA